MAKAISFFIVIAIVFVSCASPSVVTTFKKLDDHTGNIHSVLVVGAITAEDTVTRNQVEEQFLYELKKAGYHAMTSLTTFGPKGLANLGQEQTLLKLCNYGFDAVLIIALVDGSKVKYNDPPKTGPYAASYYLDRIWNYEKIQADISNRQTGSQDFWECILFDLYSLRPLSAVQTQLYDVDKSGAIDPGLAKSVIAKMKHEKILRKRNGGKLQPASQPVVKQ